MTDLDGVYIESVQVATADAFGLNFQANDLTQPTTLQSSYSDSFSLPDSLQMRRLTGHAEQLDSGSKDAYRPLPAKVVNRGETVFEGFAEFSEFSAGWQVALYEQKLNLFDRLDRSLRTLQLGRLDHYWTIEQINNHAAATDGVCYPLIDCGLLSNNLIPYDTMFPAVFVKTLMAQMLSEEGYTLVGDLLDDTLYQRLIIPFSEDQPTSHDDQWSKDRFARVTLQAPPDLVDRGTLGEGNFLDRVQPYTIDNQDTFYQGILHPFDTHITATGYVCPDDMHLQVQVSQIFKVMVVNGSCEEILSIERNGNKVVDRRITQTGLYNPLFSRPDTISLDETIVCKKGDIIQIRLEARRFTRYGAFRYEVYNDPDHSFCSFTPSLTTAFGDNWPVARNLPDLTCLDLLKAVAFAMEGIWLVDARKKQVSFSSLTAITDNQANAVDWSERLNTGNEPKWSPRLSPYCQNNLLTWKETTESKATATTVNSISLNYGDGIIAVDAPALEISKPLFEVAFGASTDSDKELAGYGHPVLVKIRTTSGSGTSLNISQQSTTPRLLLASLGEAYAVQTTRLADDGVTLDTLTVNLKPCWFGQRPYPVMTSEPAQSLSFATPFPSRGEIGLIDSYYKGLSRVLRRMRVLTVSMRLRPADIARLDFRKPVRLQRTTVGSLTIADGCYVLNKIDGYSSSGLCSVTLVAFD